LAAEDAVEFCWIVGSLKEMFVSFAQSPFSRVEERENMTQGNFTGERLVDIGLTKAAFDGELDTCWGCVG
jgi:hypothetical protein